MRQFSCFTHVMVLWGHIFGKFPDMKVLTYVHEDNTESSSVFERSESHIGTETRFQKRWKSRL